MLIVDCGSFGFFVVFCGCRRVFGVCRDIFDFEALLFALWFFEVLFNYVFLSLGLLICDDMHFWYYWGTLHLDEILFAFIFLVCLHI